MIKTVEELKELILWAKEKRVKSLKIQGMEFELSESDMWQGLDAGTPLPFTELTQPASSPKLPDGNAEVKEEDELLYWSTR